MATLLEIPKYGFGTAYDIITGTSPHRTSQQQQRLEPHQATSTSAVGQSLFDDRITEKDFKAILYEAIQMGCRHIDCAPLYGTQKLVGQVLREALIDIPRKDFFITSKLPVNMMRGENILKSIKSSMAELQVSYLDLFLIHAPFATKYVKEDLIYPLDDDGNLLLDEDATLLESAWRELVRLKEKGMVRYIGLSNINMDQLIRVNKIYQVDVIQNEYHLYNQDRELFDYCEEVDVHYEAYAAFGCPPKARIENGPCFLSDATVARVASERKLTKPQVIIEWLHRQPLSYVIRCDNMQQIRENFGYSLSMGKGRLTTNDMIDLDSLNRDHRLYLFDRHRGIVKHLEYPFCK